MQKARLAEQAERYDDMAAAMKSVSAFKNNKRQQLRLRNMRNVLSLLCVRKGSSRSLFRTLNLRLHWLHLSVRSQIIIIFHVCVFLSSIHRQLSVLFFLSRVQIVCSFGRCLSVGRAAHWRDINVNVNVTMKCTQAGAHTTSSPLFAFSALF